ncbi:MAG: hypothetical protein AAFY54_11450 [Cyanobacteria bacterium J06648_10]
MSLPIGLVLLSVVIIAGGYWLTRTTLGSFTANRNLRYVLPWLLLGMLVPLVISLLDSYALSVLYALYAVTVLLWLLGWPLRKRQAGDMLLRVGTTLQNRIIFVVGLLLVGVAIALTLATLDLFTGALTTTAGMLSGLAKLAFWWTLALLFLAVGQSNLELHEHGLTHLFAWQPWERIVAFGWDDDKPNTLILKAKPRTVLSRRYITLSIPESQSAEVDRLLEDYLLETDLAAEMDGEFSTEAG